MIYFVDEDVALTEAWRAAVALKGHEVSPIEWVEDAEEILLVADDIDLVVVDVMLAQRASTEAYAPHVVPGSGLAVGLTLVERLIAARPDIFPGSVVLWTHVRNESILAQCRSKKNDWAVEFIRKRDYRSPAKFAALVEVCLGHLQNGGTTGGSK